MSATDRNLPWLSEPLAALVEALASGRLPHAILIEGADGVGKAALANRLSAILLCSEPDHGRRPCGKCKACRLFLAGTHPDFRSLEPEEGKQGVGVDQVRELISALVLTGQLSTMRVGLITPADSMSHGAANSLLKTLEEPPPGTTLLLLTSRAATLPATVRSRCRSVKVGIPSPGVALEWLSALDAGIDWAPLLRLAGGAPLRALSLKEAGHAGLDARLASELGGILQGRADPLQVASNWEKTGAALCLDWLYRQVLSLAQTRALGTPPQDVLQKAGQNIDLELLFGYADEVNRARAILGTSVNKLLLLEGLLVPWTRGLKTGAGTRRAEKA